MLLLVFFKQKTAYEMRISDWSSDVCSSYLTGRLCERFELQHARHCRHARKMAWEKWFVESDVLDRRQLHAFFIDQEDPIDQQKRIAMRQQLENLANIKGFRCCHRLVFQRRSEEHTSELQSLMRISYAVFCLTKKNKNKTNTKKRLQTEQNYT